MSLTDLDREFFERELASFIPNRVFDAHAHFNHPDFFDRSPPSVPKIVGHSEYREYIDQLHPGREFAAQFISFSFDRQQIPLANAWVAKNIANQANCRGLFCVTPEDDPEWVRQEVRRLGLQGLKPYHLFAAQKPTWDADIPAYLPESLMKIADEEGWVITLHMVKPRAVADPGNIHWIRHYCQTYPNAKIILAHSARGFQPMHNLQGLPKLQGLKNLYFDTSANCEPLAHQAILRFFGHEKLMYGSDGLLASHIRGRTIGVADSFLWITEDLPVWEAGYATIQPVLVGLEHLRSLKVACWSENLNDTAVEDIFWNNAARLFALENK